MSDSRVFLVHGPPGTGKTTYLSRQAKAAATKHSPNSVAIASLTRTAAAEIGGRDTGIPEDNVGTLHAHCYRALDRPQLAETPEGIRAWNDTHPHLALTGGAQDQLEDTIDLDGGRTGGDDLHAAVMNHRARQTPPELWTSQQREYLAHWNDFKQRTDRLDFTDLIETCLQEVDQHPAAPRVLLLDEAQDFSRLELALAVKWAAHTETTVIVGDPCQALYAWRGSDPDALTSLPLAGERVLHQSYRVPRAVHQLALRWLHQLPDAPIRSYEPTEQPGETSRAHATLKHPEQLVDAIRDDIAAGRTVMVLTTCGYMLAPVLKVLRTEGIPFHNPYRVKQGAWNPMRAAQRLTAFLRPRADVWGDQARTWTWDDLRLWTEPLQARGVLARGAKDAIKEKCREDRFGESHADREVPMETLMTLLGTYSVRHPAFRLDVDWLADHLLASKAKTLEYPLEVYRRQGGQALRQTPPVVIGTIHSVKGGEADCSPGDEPVLTTNRGYVPIAELDPDADRLVSFNSDHHRIHRGGPRRPDGYRFRKAVRPYIGPLLTFETETSRTRVTPNHHLTVRWNERILSAYAVYLMRRGRDWRIGVTAMHHANGQSGPVMRANREGADAVWLVDLFDDLADAIAAERQLAWTYGVPDITFKVTDREIATQEQQDAIWSELDSERGALRLLAIRGQSPDWPLWGPAGGRSGGEAGLRNRWTIRAANFVAGYMDIPTDPGSGQSPVWRTPTVSVEHFAGDVYSLDVERWHHYVSGGAIVHNCVYLFPDLSRTGMYQGWHPGGAGRDQIIRMIYVALTRARHKVTILDPAAPEHVPLQLLTPEPEAIAA